MLIFRGDDLRSGLGVRVEYGPIVLKHNPRSHSVSQTKPIAEDIVKSGDSQAGTILCKTTRSTSTR